MNVLCQRLLICAANYLLGLVGLTPERAPLDITPVVGPLSDDRRMMNGPSAWSADGSQIIAARNEGDATVLIIAAIT